MIAFKKQILKIIKTRRKNSNTIRGTREQRQNLSSYGHILVFEIDPVDLEDVDEVETCRA
jgi:hypothetical protein